MGGGGTTGGEDSWEADGDEDREAAEKERVRSRGDGQGSGTPDWLPPAAMRRLIDVRCTDGGRE